MTLIHALSRCSSPASSNPTLILMQCEYGCAIWAQAGQQEPRQSAGALCVCGCALDCMDNKDKAFSGCALKYMMLKY